MSSQITLVHVVSGMLLLLTGEEKNAVTRDLLLAKEALRINAEDSNVCSLAYHNNKHITAKYITPNTHNKQHNNTKQYIS